MKKADLDLYTDYLLSTASSNSKCNFMNNGLGGRDVRASRLSIPVNVTADSGNVTGIPANVTEGRCCAF